jgi:hypothetical protein
MNFSLAAVIIFLRVLCFGIFAATLEGHKRTPVYYIMRPIPVTSPNFGDMQRPTTSLRRAIWNRSEIVLLIWTISEILQHLSDDSSFIKLCDSLLALLGTN